MCKSSKAKASKLNLPSSRLKHAAHKETPTTRVYSYFSNLHLHIFDRHVLRSSMVPDKMVHLAGSPVHTFRKWGN